MNLSLEEKVSQKFILGINSNNIDDIVYFIKEYKIGGVILYKKNYKTYQDMLDVIKKLKLANKDNKLPLFIAIDQEGGTVNRIPKEIENVCNMHDISRANMVYEAAKAIGIILKESGINMNLAPVLDIDNELRCRALYKRCFYGEVNDIIGYGYEYMKGMHEEGIIPVCKHFPGQGISKIDPHIISPYIFNYQNVVNKHMTPFRKMAKDIDVMMIGHLVIRKLTRMLPASISKKFIAKYVREICGFNGVIVTDEIKMLSRNPLYMFIYIRKALLAGNDIILTKIRNREDGINILNKAYRICKDNNELDESVNRIISIKEKYKIDDDISFDGVDVDKINKRIRKINDSLLKGENNI